MQIINLPVDRQPLSHSLPCVIKINKYTFVDQMQLVYEKVHHIEAQDIVTHSLRLLQDISMNEGGCGVPMNRF